MVVGGGERVLLGGEPARAADVEVVRHRVRAVAQRVRGRGDERVGGGVAGRRREHLGRLGEARVR